MEIPFPKIVYRKLSKSENSFRVGCLVSCREDKENLNVSGIPAVGDTKLRIFIVQEATTFSIERLILSEHIKRHSA